MPAKSENIAGNDPDPGIVWKAALAELREQDE
jgi:hypothetical protein